MKYSSIFDVIGHIMVGPSSSHTAGACRIGYIANKLLGRIPDSVIITLHGSFAETYQGHGTDKALLAGLLGIPPDDERIRMAFSLAKERNMNYSFIKRDLGAEYHPNSVLIEMKAGSDELSVLGSSIGGGNIIIQEIDGLEAGFTGQMPTLILINRDKIGVLAKVTDSVAKFNLNIATMRVSRNIKKKISLMFLELNQPIPDALVETLIKIPEIVQVRPLNV
jgi:L-serine dehydratase